MQKPDVGRIVKFNVGDGDRPMLIVRVWNDDCVNGRVFMDGTNDHHVLRQSGLGVIVGGDLWVTSRTRGKEIGQWRFHDDP